MNKLNKVKYSFFSSSNNNNANSGFSGIHDDFKPKTKVEVTDENVMKIIDDYVKNNDIVLFMKGTKEMPKCGFSNYLIQVLKFYKIDKFVDVNVLASEAMRQGVKKYSNWPTFPQLYIKGELIGGCDIVKEMHESGNFENLLKSHNLNN
jgi:monothiol glutaredoxin